MTAIFKKDKEQEYLFKLVWFSLKFVLTFLPHQVFWLLASNNEITVEL